MSELISVRVLQAFGSWFPSNIAGFAEEAVAAYIKKGLVEALDAPADPAPPAAPPVDDKVSPPPSQASAVEIPIDWSAQHALKKIALAKKIVGAEAVPEGATLAWAEPIIIAELASREAAIKKD